MQDLAYIEMIPMLLAVVVCALIRALHVFSDRNGADAVCIDLQNACSRLLGISTWLCLL